MSFLGKSCRPRMLACMTVMLSLVGFTHGALSQEIEPREFVPLPAGTNINLLYYINGESPTYYTTSGTKVGGSNINVNLGLERFVHYGSVAGMPAGVQVFQGFGSEADARLGGQSLGSSFGAANTVLSAFIWPYANTQANQYLVIAGFLYPPDGSYDKNQSVNLAGAISGWQGWTGDLQAGWDNAIGDHFSYDASADVRFFGATTGPIQPNVPISVQSHKDTDLRLQLWLNWAWNRAFSTSVGYEGFFFGDTYFDNPALLGGVGRTNTGSSREQRLRAAASMFLSPKAQILLEVNHDVDRSGGFRQDFGVTARFLYIF